MPETEKVLLALAAATLIVLGVNLVLIVPRLRSRIAREADAARKAAERARAPWREEDETLAELHRRVAGLREAGMAGGASPAAPPSDRRDSSAS
ncbi:MAG: hypothetical protein ACRDHY_10175 [Anaerolineales bacterium]